MPGSELEPSLALLLKREASPWSNALGACLTSGHFPFMSPGPRDPELFPENPQPQSIPSWRHLEVDRTTTPEENFVYLGRNFKLLRGLTSALDLSDGFLFPHKG